MLLLLLLLLSCCAGPLLPLDLPRLEHICTSCFPACVGDKCLLSIEVTYPKVRPAQQCISGCWVCRMTADHSDSRFTYTQHSTYLLAHSSQP
jgi:hypothetical protein